MARSILTLVRHGQTSANTDRVWHGSSDTLLTDRGHAQALAVAEFLAAHSQDAVAVYASSLTRAQHTARPIAERLGLAPRTADDLREYDLGAWEGKTYRELHEVEDLWTHIRNDPDFAPHGGESPRQVIERVTGCLRTLAASHPGERVIVIVHGAALAMTLGEILEPGTGRWSRPMDNCAVSEFVFEPEPELLSFNLDAHLIGESSTSS